MLVFACGTRRGYSGKPANLSPAIWRTAAQPARCRPAGQPLERKARPMLTPSRLSQLPDLDASEPAEWLKSLDAITARVGPERARYLVLRLNDHAVAGRHRRAN